MRLIKNINNIRQKRNRYYKKKINHGVDKSVEIKKESQVATENLQKIIQRIMDMHDFINNIASNVDEQTKASENFG